MCQTVALVQGLCKKVPKEVSIISTSTRLLYILNFLCTLIFNAKKQACNVQRLFKNMLFAFYGII